MVRYIGMDVHKRSMEVCLTDAQGRVLARHTVPTTRAALEEWAQAQLLPTDQGAVEATLHTWTVVRVLRPLCARLVVSNPLQTKAIAQAQVKTDKIDAEVLAHLLRCDYLPLVWEPAPEVEERRTLLGRLPALVAERTRHGSVSWWSRRATSRPALTTGSSRPH